jgi:hypothetical protein
MKIYDINPKKNKIKKSDNNKARKKLKIIITGIAINKYNKTFFKEIFFKSFLNNVTNRTNIKHTTINGTNTKIPNV